MDGLTKQFYGRKRLIRAIVAGVRGPGPDGFSIVGSKLIGKSKLLAHLASPHGPLAEDDSKLPVATQISCSRHDAQEDIVAFIALRLGQQARESNDLQLEWDEIEREPDPARRIWQINRRLVESGRRAVLLMDDFDALLQADSLSPETVDVLHPLLQEMSLVVTTEQPLHDLDRNLIAAPLFKGMTQLFLGLVTPAASEEWIRSYCHDYPALEPATAELVQMTGYHPFLIERLGYILADAQEMLMSGQQLGPEHLPLIRMRLSEHGRQLFVLLWQRLQTPPRRVNVRTLMPLLERLLQEPLPIEEVSPAQSPALNWLINQAVVVYGDRGYQFASPLFAEFLNRRIGSGANAPVRSASADRGDSPFLDSLTKTESALLRYFQSNSNTVISSEQLLADVWHRPDASPRRVQEAIRRLRLRLDEAMPPVGVIENERGRGYRFVPADI